MHVQKLVKLLEQPETLSPGDIPVLEALTKEYPYFYLAYALLAKVAYVQEHDVQQYVVQRAATYSPNRPHLRSWLENKRPTPPLTKQSQSKSSQEGYGAANNYLQMIATKSVKKSTNETSIKQFSIIDNILNKNLQFDPFIDAEPLKDKPPVDLSERKTTLNDHFATETLAGIMVKQKKYKRAIEIYEYLMLKYPEKKPYFGNIISSLNHNL
ncbi:hypothetical protein [Cardinium endosymbiont of Tipula unca]|uniref:hypothetical protein n=1 Tax=Cardinium endosymbiont of Tipula unca TaxID=3066216 RepID=UPI0030D20884